MTPPDCGDRSEPYESVVDDVDVIGENPALWKYWFPGTWCGAGNMAVAVADGGVSGIGGGRLGKCCRNPLVSRVCRESLV